MVGNKHLGNASVITIECVVLKDGVLATTSYGFSNLEIVGDSKVIIDGYNQKKKVVYLVQSIF